MSACEPRLLRWVCWSIAALGFGYLVFCVSGRLCSHWPLEWMEGASVVHAQRLVHGLSIYAPPRADFIPFVYPPLGYLPMALGLVVSKGELWGARLASLGAVAVCLGALIRAGQHVSATRCAGLLAAGLFGLGYGYTGGFVDVARVDAWFIALCLCGVERVCAQRPVQGLAWLALGCLVKQHALLLLIAASGGLWLSRGRRSLSGLLPVWLALALSCLLLYGWSHGWIWTYCVAVPARHGIDKRLLLSFVLVDLGVYLPLLSGLVIGSLMKRREAVFVQLHLLLIAAIVASALGRAHPGGDDNVRLPAYALIVLVASLSFVELLRGTAAAWGRGALVAALMLQVAMLVQSPALYWPNRRSDKTAMDLRAQLAHCAAGADFVAMDLVSLGNRPFVHTLALSDLRMNQDALGARATRVVLDALRKATGPAAIAISASFPDLSRVLAEHYELCARVPAQRMPTGYSLGRSDVYRRRSP